MNGKYIFRSNGEIIGVHENLITNNGKRALLNFLSGYSGTFIGDLAVGIGESSASLNDTGLQFEVDRAPVVVKSPEYGTMSITHKTTLNGIESYKIYEVGACAPSMNDNSMPIISDFGFGWNAGTADDTNSRYGSALVLSAGTSATSSATLENVFFDFGQVSNYNNIVIAGYAPNQYVSNIKVSFMTDSSNYYTAQFNSPVSGEYGIFSMAKGSLVATGSPAWSNIYSISVSVTSSSGGSGAFHFDALKIEPTDQQDQENQLISRSVLTAPIQKESGVPLDIEYVITI